jgi:regulatory protein YycI of two-component signal transduction system YycFG
MARKIGHNTGIMLILILIIVVVLLYFLYPRYQPIYNSHSTSGQNTSNSTNSSTITNGTAEIAVNLQSELNNSAAFNTNQSMFYATSFSDCSRQQITQCDNNVPDQFICVNSQYSSYISAQYRQLYGNQSAVCPDFILAGSIACGISANYCVVISSNPTHPQNVSTSNSSG